MELTISDIYWICVVCGLTGFLGLTAVFPYIHDKWCCIPVAFISIFMVFFFSIIGSRIDMIDSASFIGHPNIFLADRFAAFKIGDHAQKVVVTFLVHELDEKIIKTHCSVKMANFLEVQTVSTLKEVGVCYRENAGSVVEKVNKVKRLRCLYAHS